MFYTTPTISSGYSYTPTVQYNPGYIAPTPELICSQYTLHIIVVMSCWLIFLVSGWVSLGVPEGMNRIWYLNGATSGNLETYGDMHFAIQKVTFVITLLLGTLSFGYYFVLAINRSINIFIDILGPVQKFHVVPILCAAALFILGEVTGVDDPEPDPDPGPENKTNQTDNNETNNTNSTNINLFSPEDTEPDTEEDSKEKDKENDDEDDEEDSLKSYHSFNDENDPTLMAKSKEDTKTGDKSKSGDDDSGDDDSGGDEDEEIHAICIVDIIFTVLGLSSLIFIYRRTVITANYLMSIFVKKGVYSCLIALYIYNLIYMIGFYGIKLSEGEGDEFKTGFGYAIIVINGLSNIAVSYIFADYVISGINILINMGICIACLKLADEKIKGGYVALAFMFCSLVNIVYMIHIYRMRIFFI